MIPKISARFRRRQGVPYAIEQLSGKQFRCRHCNQVFIREMELDRHIAKLMRSGDRNKTRISASAPTLSFNIDTRVFYSYDIVDRLKRQWLKLKKGDVYDGT